MASNDIKLQQKPSFDLGEEEDEKSLSLTSQIICDILKQNTESYNGNDNEESPHLPSCPELPDPQDVGRCWLGQVCHPTSPANDQKCRLLRQLSVNLLSGTPIEPELVDEATNNVLTYLDGTPEEVRTAIAHYLSSGKTDDVYITMDTLHYFFHVARTLHLQQLQMHCFSFCFLNSQREVLSCFVNCTPCRQIMSKESAEGFERLLSMHSDPDEASLPEFFIAFSTCPTGKGNQVKPMAIVVDISQKKDIFKCMLANTQTFEKGFRSCACDVKNSPYIFVSGGMGKHSNMLWKYDVIMESWQKGTRMHHGRSKHVMVSVRDERIFVLGGQEVPCIEEYNIKEKTWTERGSLKVPVCSAVGIAHCDSIFVFGGRTTAGTVSTVQCYDLKTNRVTTLDDLPVAFKWGQAVVMGDSIYIATGQGHMICFDPATGSSHLCSQQPMLRNHFGMFARDGRIYLVGGTPRDPVKGDEGQGEAPQYRYNPEKDQWVRKDKLCRCFPVYSSCIIKYPQKCSIVPFHGM